jgi:uncharacterized protein YjbJ (UPF0337 family)
MMSRKITWTKVLFGQFEPKPDQRVDLSNTNNRTITMDENRVARTARNVAGKAQEGVGRLAGDVKTEMEGRLNQAAGSAQELYGQARDAAREGVEAVQESADEVAKTLRKQSAGLEQKLRSSMNARPLMTVAMALGVGWFLGRMLHR